MSISLSAVRCEPRERFAPIQVFARYDETPLTLNDHLRAIHSASTRLHFRRGETIFSEGEPADNVYKVLNGTVRLCRFLPDGRRHITDFMLAGDLIGFLECADHPAAAEAVDDVTLVSYPRSSVDRLTASDPAIRRRILCHLSSALLEAQHHLFVLGSKNARERVASFIVRLADRTDIGAGEALDIAMSRQDIADHLGLTGETVCRVLSLLKTEGIVAIPNASRLVLKDLGAVRALAVES